MQVKALYVYPIKALRGISLETAQLGPLGIRYDRRFMLFHVKEDGSLKKVQLDAYPQCTLFEQRIVDDSNSPSVVVHYRAPPEPLVPPRPAQQEELTVPLEPDTDQLEKTRVDLHNSPASVAYRMGPSYDSWFSDCFGFDAILVYIGDGRRPVLGQTLVPPTYPQQQQQQQQSGSWLSSITSYVTGSSSTPDRPVLGFSDMAPFLVTSEASLADVASRFSPENPVEMYRFRPNIVVDGEDKWAEDFWSELTIHSDDDSPRRLFLTGNCARCTSLNADYVTGRVAAGELGSVLKSLMRDRRVDKGSKWSPVFGRYAFLDGSDEVRVSVGDPAEVTGRTAERSVWDWPL